MPLEGNPPRAEPQRTTDEIEHRALARAVGPDQPQDFTSLELERKIVDRNQASKLSARTIDDKQRAVAAARPLWKWCGLRPRRARSFRERAGKPRPQAVARALQQQDHQYAEYDDLEISVATEQARQVVLQQLLE